MEMRNPRRRRRNRNLVYCMFRCHRLLFKLLHILVLGPDFMEAECGFGVVARVEVMHIGAMKRWMCPCTRTFWLMRDIYREDFDNADAVEDDGPALA